MRKLLKNKKGFDWSFLIALITVICIVALFIQLNKKIENFDKPIGKMQMDIVGMMQKGDNVLFYIGQSGRLSACDAVYDLAEKGGFDSPACGQTLPLLEAGVVPQAHVYSYWFKDGKKCYPGINFYKQFENVFSRSFKDRLNAYNFFGDKQAYIPLDNYEFMIKDSLIVGSAIKNIELATAQVVAGELGAGKYVFKPSFAIDFRTGIDDYFKLHAAVDALVECNEPMQECIRDINTPGLNWSFDAVNPATFIFVVEQENINCRFAGEKPNIRFAIEKPLTIAEVVEEVLPVPSP